MVGVLGNVNGKLSCLVYTYNMRYFGHSAIRFQPEKCKQGYCLIVNKFMNINLDLKLAKSMTVIMSSLNRERGETRGPRPSSYLMNDDNILGPRLPVLLHIFVHSARDEKWGKVNKAGCKWKETESNGKSRISMTGWGRRQLQREWTPTYSDEEMTTLTQCWIWNHNLWQKGLFL